MSSSPHSPSDPPLESPFSADELQADLEGGGEASAAELVALYRADLLPRARAHPWMRALSCDTSAEDIVQEVFSRALASHLFCARAGRKPGSLRRALDVVLERVLADQLRLAGAAKRGGNYNHLSIDKAAEDTGSPLFRQLASPSTTPTVSARSAELIRICQLILDDHEWQVWRLRAVAGLDFDSIASLVGTSSAAARGQMFRARKKLILALADLDPDGESA